MSRKSTGKHRRCSGWRVGAVILITLVAARAQTLFDAAVGTLPENQGWSYLAFESVPVMLINQSAFLDTSNSAGIQAGWAKVAPVPLSRTDTFTLLFTLQLHSETHNSENRAGLSIIALGQDRRGIELGFWANTVFAQGDSPLFTHAEEASFSATNFFINYALTLRATNYCLRANGAPLLSGPVRDYTAFNGLPDPYETPNFLFIGDDTRSAGAAFALRSFVLIRAPSLTTPRPGIISWTGVSNQVYTIQSSSNLTGWTDAGTAASTDSVCRFTNSPSQDKMFFRVVGP